VTDYTPEVMGESPPPGWYPDPAGARRGLRYWDGLQWTAQRGAGTSNWDKAVLIGIACVAFIAVAAFLAGFRGDDISPMDESGTFYHIDDSAAGIYETAGSDRPNGRPCRWERRTGTRTDIHGSYEDVVEWGNVGPGQQKQVKLRGGEYFVSYGCKPWHHVGD